MSTVARRLDTSELEHRVKRMYKEVALEPEREFHFETGRPLAERLGYPPAELDRIPAAAIDSFAGVGYFLDLAAITPGETVLDLGSGSGTDSFLAALATGTNGQVIGIDMTHQQRAKARRLAELPADREVVAYCRGPFCAYAHEAVRRLQAAGRPARRLGDGWPEWQLAQERSTKEEAA